MSARNLTLWLTLGRKRAGQARWRRRLPSLASPRKRRTGSPRRPLQGETKTVIWARPLRLTRRVTARMPTVEGASWTTGAGGVGAPQVLAVGPTRRETVPLPEIA